jgi:5-methylcytosine-specific restriction endonuclease McrA
MQSWRKSNKDKMRSYTRKQIAIKSGNIHEDWTEQELLSIYGTDCYLCNQPIDFDAPRKGAGSANSLWPDHMIPTSRGGENTIRNVRPCHSSCNISKHNKTYEEYMLTANSQEIVIQM